LIIIWYTIINSKITNWFPQVRPGVAGNAFREARYGVLGQKISEFVNMGFRGIFLRAGGRPAAWNVNRLFFNEIEQGALKIAHFSALIMLNSQFSTRPVQ
jgi:hypothetical protein